MERFSCRTAVVSGAGAMEALGERPWGKMLLIGGPELEDQEVQNRIRQAAGNPRTTFFDGAEVNMARAVAGSQRLKEFGPDLVVAVGDDRILDLGKAMVGFSKHRCMLAAVPTAPGSGAALTDQVELSHNGRIHLLRDDSMQPELVILDDRVTDQMTGNQVAQGGFELLAAALETYSGGKGELLSDFHSREAFTVGWAALPAAFAGNKQARQKLQMASVLAGMARKGTGLGLCRAMENSLTMVYGISRGKAAAMLLPVVIGCNVHAAGRKYAELSRAAGLGGSRAEIGAQNLKNGLIRLRQELGLPGTLVQAGVELRSVWNNSRKILELTLEDPACRCNPVAVDDFLVRRILEEITGRI